MKARIDQLRERARMLRAEYEERFPGASEEWEAITDLDREVQELAEEHRRLQKAGRADEPRPTCPASRPPM